MPRRAALDWARAAREVRVEVHDELSAGRLSVADLLERARRDEFVGHMKLLPALESLPGAGKVDTRRRLAVLGIDGSTQLGSLPPDRAGAIEKEFGPAEGGSGTGRRPPALPEGTSVVVISGPGGVGKGTVVAELLRRDPRLWVSRSWTTRDRRPGEAPDAYHFVSEDEFRRRIDEGGFLEWTGFLDYLQGSPVPEPPAGRDVLFEIDVQGADNVKRLYPDALLVFIDAPDRATQEQRLRGRGDSEERIRQRLAKAIEEVERAATLDFVHVVNDDLDRAVEQVAALIEAHRH